MDYFFRPYLRGKFYVQKSYRGLRKVPEVVKNSPQSTGQVLDIFLKIAC